jgi:hypothetical protein
VFALVIFFLPETQYYRTSTAQAQSPQSSNLENEAPKLSTNPTLKQKDPTSVERNDPTGLETREVNPADKKSVLQELNPWSGINPDGHKASYLTLAIRSWPLTLYPAVIFSALSFGWRVAAVICILDTAPSTFQSPPYNMSPVQSLIVMPVLVARTLGPIFGGLGTKLYCRYRASNNNGVFEPENGQIMVFSPVFLGSAVIIMFAPVTKRCWWPGRYGWGIAKQYPWPLSWIGFGVLDSLIA